jgi:hypothetical protein
VGHTTPQAPEKAIGLVFIFLPQRLEKLVNGLLEAWFGKPPCSKGFRSKKDPRASIEIPIIPNDKNSRPWMDCILRIPGIKVPYTYS